VVLFDFLASAHVVLLCDPRGSVHDLDTIPSASIWFRRSLEWSSLEARRSLVENALHITLLASCMNMPVSSIASWPHESSSTVRTVSSLCAGPQTTCFNNPSMISRTSCYSGMQHTIVLRLEEVMRRGRGKNGVCILPVLKDPRRGQVHNI
jgi:hypothetical protein